MDLPPPSEPPVRVERKKRCLSCYLPISNGARYCPSCGAYQNPAFESTHRMEQAERGWRLVKGTIVFYAIYLCSVLPIVWLPSENIATVALIVTAFDAVSVLVYWWISKIPLWPLLRWNTEIARVTGLSLLTLVPLVIFNLLYHSRLTNWLDMEAISLLRPYDNEGYPFWVAVFALCLMPAVWEEIGFRGLIQGQLGKVLNPREALVLTAVLFAIIHCSVLSGVYLLLLGFVLGWLRQRSGSLLPGMVLHFVHNFVVLTIEKWNWISL